MENITFERGKKLVFYLEPEALPGVKKTAEKVAQDFEKVCGAKPEIVETVCEEDSDFCGNRWTQFSSGGDGTTGQT